MVEGNVIILNKKPNLKLGFLEVVIPVFWIHPDPILYLTL